MWNIFRGALLALVRNKEIFIWSLAFPIILATMFMLMFSNLDDAVAFDPIPTALVEDDNYQNTPAFSSVIDQLAKPGDDQLIYAQYFTDKASAEEALLAGSVSGIISVNNTGAPSLAVGASGGMTSVSTEQINRTILKTVVDTYLRNANLMADIAANNPAALANPQALEEAFTSSKTTMQVSLTHNEPAQSVRYYYALLGMAALFCGQMGLSAICATQPNLSALGARRAVGGISRGKTLAATLGASWVISFACLVIAFIYIRLGVGVDFGGREPLCIAAIALAALLATSLGTFLGALPKINATTKAGILTATTCFLSLFAGLYGEPCMKLADQFSRSFPVLASLNPAKVITDAFYSLYYYDALGPFFEKAGILVAMSAVLFAVSALLMRRQRYASL